jgi:hypothetical protein
MARAADAMNGHTYRDLALRYEVEVCFDGCFRRDHRRGGIDSQGTIHWSDRRMTRSGLRRFLMLVAEAYRLGSDWPQPEFWVTTSFRGREALRTYNGHIFAYRTALHDLGIRLPASLAAEDKAKVRALLASAPFELRNSGAGRWAGLR